MRKVILFIAMSLDGYIADENGSVRWLEGEKPDANMPDIYSDFVKDVDTVIMGWKTYHQIVTELSPEKWVYDGLTSYIITHRELPPAGQIIFTSEPPCEIVASLKEMPGKNIWICGGAGIVRQLMETDLIDEFHISIMPVILGSGIRLFEAGIMKAELKLADEQTYNGIADLRYVRR